MSQRHSRVEASAGICLLPAKASTPTLVGLSTNLLRQAARLSIHASSHMGARQNGHAAAHLPGDDRGVGMDDDDDVDAP